uniref:Uncharacterized protein n=1 Tax=Oryza brachyantha TaxID=4533 RepID=J3LZ80_ORYBR
NSEESIIDQGSVLEVLLDPKRIVLLSKKKKVIHNLKLSTEAIKSDTCNQLKVPTTNCQQVHLHQIHSYQTKSSLEQRTPH